MLASVLSVTVWWTILVAFVLWELGGAIFHTPRLRDVFASVTRWRVARSLLFGMWLWVGWHFLIRGWHFFLRSRA